MDLRLRFSLPEREYDDRTCIIIAGLEQGSIGFVVDTVSEVQEIPVNSIDPPPSFKSASSKERFIMGLGKINKQVKILLNVEKIVGDQDFLDQANFQES